MKENSDKPLKTQRKWKLAEVAGLLFAVFSTLALTLHAATVFWWGPDDGAYAFVAERILRGDILNKDIQDVHPGYINFVNAGAMAVLGENAFSLRIPLIFLAALQCIFAFLALRNLGAVAASAAAIAVGYFGFAQFPNPSANWYALAFVWPILFAFRMTGVTEFQRLLLFGFLVGSAFLFRQLTGVFLGAAVFTILMLNAPAKNEDAASPLLANVVFGIAFVGIGTYLFFSSNMAGFLMYGAGSLAVLGVAAAKTRLEFREVVRVAGALTLGSLVPAAPLILFHFFNGSFEMWITDAFIAPLTLVSYDFFDTASYGILPILAGMGVAEGSASAFFNLIYWILMMVAPMALGAIAARRIWRDQNDELTPIIILAVFVGLVSVHYEIPIYLYYSAGMIWVGLIASTNTKFRTPVSIVTISVAFIAAFFHAGQPSTRGLVSIAHGERVAQEAYAIPGAAINIDANQADLYLSAMDLVANCSNPEDTIFSMPSAAEFYFLTKRQPPVRYFSTALGLHNKEDAEALEAVFLSDRRPSVVFDQKADKYNSEFLDGVRKQLRGAEYASSGARRGVNAYIVNYRTTDAGCANSMVIWNIDE
ncbi:MAG: hypothetical protein HKN14_11295 [Marinicaulis sp.]|nr:hypothetical protein [Marinicaulis sp.]